jgi:hypothetical protein
MARRPQRLTPQELEEFLDLIRPVLWEMRREDLERLLELPDLPERPTL